MLDKEQNSDKTVTFPTLPVSPAPYKKIKYTLVQIM